MRFSVNRETFLKPLEFAAGVVEKRQTMAVLSNVLMDVDKDSIILTGSDLEVELIGRCDNNIEVTQSGRITVPARKLLDICKTLPADSRINVELVKNRLLVRSGKSNFSLSTISSDEYPATEHLNDTQDFKLLEKDLKLLIQRTQFSMADHDVRYYLNGMLLEVRPNYIRTVATDGHRLAVNTIHKPQGDLSLSVLIPRKAVLELMRLLSDGNEEINISINKNHFRAYNNEFTFTSKLLEGNYPSYDRVIPKNGDKIIILDRDQARQTFSRASILSNEQFRGVRIGLNNNIMRIEANNPSQEEAEEEIQIIYPHEGIEIGFKVDYILDVLNTIKDSSVKMIFTNSQNGLVVEETVDDCESVFVVMPLHL